MTLGRIIHSGDPELNMQHTHKYVFSDSHPEQNGMTDLIFSFCRE